MKDRILLHTCCAPCATRPVEMLSDANEITFFYFNPNISPIDEYHRRKNELVRFSSVTGIPVLEGVLSVAEWADRIKQYAHLGEGSLRCRECYRFRMEETFRIARDTGYSRAGTVLSVSPHKNSGIIKEIGLDLQKIYGVEYLDIDFKKNDGYKKGVEISRKHGFYRQNYCGCIYSFIERRKRLEDKVDKTV